MENLDFALVRILVKQLCRPSTYGDAGELSPNAVFDWEEAPGYEEQRETVRTHNELLVRKRIARIERIQMNPRPDFAVLKPTDEGKIWCRYARDDEQWERHGERLRALLTS